MIDLSPVLDALEERLRRAMIEALAAVHQGEPDPETLTVPDVVERFRIPAEHIYAAAASGVLPAFRRGKALLFVPADVREWIRTEARQAAEDRLASRQVRSFRDRKAG